MRMRYRVFEPDTPRDLPLQLVQEWDSEVQLTVGFELRMDGGEEWVVAAVEPDPDPAYAGSVFFKRRTATS
jgi:hypothetical protein